MWNDIKRLYADVWAFSLALPILFSIPVLIELAQHIVEIDIGMFQRGVTGIGLDQRRLTFGFAKTLAMILPGYWFVRYMAWGRDAAKAKQIERAAAVLFGIQFALHAGTQWVGLFGPPLGVVLRLDARLGQYVGLASAVGMSVVGIYLTAWFVAWPLGNPRIGPLRSFSVMAGSFCRAVGYTLAGSVPLMLLHYALNYGAVGQADWLVWIIMGLDALIVGFLALSVAGAGYLAARRAAERTGISLDGSR